VDLDGSARGRRGTGRRAFLEQERELTETGEVFARAGSGPASLVVVADRAGIGTTSLVRAARALAQERGFGVLSHRGALEQELAYGVVRELVEPRLVAPAREPLLEGAAGLAVAVEVGGSWSEPERGRGAAADHRSPSALDGLSSLFANLAGLGPLLVLGDDAHWLAVPSLRPLAFLTRRLEERPILLLVAVHPAGILAALPAPAIELDRAVAIFGDGTELTQTGIFGAGGALRLARPIVRRNRRRPAADQALPRAPAGARTPLEDLGLVVFAASTAIHCARIDLLAGDPSRAEAELRHAHDALASINETYLLPPIAELLAQVVCVQGHLDEAEEISRAAAKLAASDEVELQALWPAARGSDLTWQERADEAERRAREAVDLIRIRTALSRLTTWVSQNARAENERSASDRRARHADRRADAAHGPTRERFLRDILANKKLPDGYARAVALETLDIPEEQFAQMLTSSGTAGPAQTVPEGLITEEVAVSKLAEFLQRLRSES
jgi:hypothetical protein